MNTVSILWLHLDCEPGRDREGRAWFDLTLDDGEGIAAMAALYPPGKLPLVPLATFERLPERLARLRAHYARGLVSLTAAAAELREVYGDLLDELLPNPSSSGSVDPVAALLEVGEEGWLRLSTPAVKLCEKKTAIKTVQLPPWALAVLVHHRPHWPGGIPISCHLVVDAGHDLRELFGGWPPGGLGADRTPSTSS